ncbi:hypothetical protein SORBI_3003G029400 [Sorghum bicolor]|nr:hypothetical protein SORBI_3003G029400 [Sorghum bicolor]
MEPGLGKRLMTVLRAVYHMLRRGLCRKRLMMDLHLLLGRGKLAGKALRDLLAAAHHSHSHHHNHMVVPSSSTSRAGRRAPSSASALPATATATPGGLSFVGPYDPRDVEFSCTTTPSYSFGHGAAGHLAPARALFPFKIRGRGSSAARAGCDGLDFAQVARALEKMHADDEASAGSGADDQAASPSPSVAGATPSPMLALSLGRSPAGARRLRVTDSPFPVDPPEGLDARADSTFDAFISKFYETLRLQQADATPDNRARRRG